MSRVIRFLLQFITTTLTILVIAGILGGSFWYMWRVAKAQAMPEPYVITATKLERAFLGLYLRSKGDMVHLPVSPDDPSEVTFVVRPGQSLLGVSQSLAELNLVADAEVFRRFVQYSGADEDIQAGAYLLQRNMTMEQIMLQLQRGLLPTATVTIPEGWRMEQIARELEAKGVTSAQAFLELARAEHDEWTFLTDRPTGSARGLEGFLFPDTYQFPRNTSPETVIEIMLRNFDWRFSGDLRQMAEDRGLTLFEVVTLASIIEREAVAAEERPIIASVFWNRLEIGMALQADPTVQYALGCDAESGECWQQLTREQLNSVQSPYNTYLNPGLTPGPICNPGLASIRAVLEPAETGYFYFVALEDGKHVFSETYEEHLRQDAARGQ
jgi:UPF0755 protein